MKARRLFSSIIKFWFYSPDNSFKITVIIIVRLIIEQIHLVVKRFFEIGAYFVIEICK